MARVRRRSGSPYWYADFYDRAGTRHQPSTRRTRRRDAQELADLWERESLRDLSELARDRATLGDALELLSAHLLECVRSGAMSDATAQHYVAKARAVKQGFGAETLLRTINTGTVRDYCARRRAPHVVEKKNGTQTYRGAGNHTLVKEINALRLALRLAKERGLWSGDLETIQPAELSARYVPRARSLTPDEAWSLREPLMQRSPGRWALVAFALATGAEPAALFRAERGDVDQAREWVHVRGSKNDVRDRMVPVVLEECRHLLEEALTHADGDRPRRLHVREERAAKRARRLARKGITTPEPVAPLAPDAAGRLFRPWTSTAAGACLARACRAVGLEPVTLTDLRRSWATWHVEAGAQLDTLFRFAGHVDAKMLSQVYGKPRPEPMAEHLRAQLERNAPQRTSKK